MIECGIASHRIVDSRLAATYACGLRCAAAAAARRRNLLRLSHVAARRPVLQRVAASAAALSRLARAACQVYMRHKNCSRLKPPKATKGVGLTRYEYSAAPGSAAPSAISTLGMVIPALITIISTLNSIIRARITIISTQYHHLYHLVPPVLTGHSRAQEGGVCHPALRGRGAVLIARLPRQEHRRAARVSRQVSTAAQYSRWHSDRPPSASSSAHPLLAKQERLRVGTIVAHALHRTLSHPNVVCTCAPRAAVCVACRPCWRPSLIDRSIDQRPTATQQRSHPG